MQHHPAPHLEHDFKDERIYRIQYQYDAVFKHLMEDKKIAKLFLSALTGLDIRSLQPLPQELIVDIGVNKNGQNANRSKPCANKSKQNGRRRRSDDRRNKQNGRRRRSDGRRNKLSACCCSWGFPKSKSPKNSASLKRIWSDYEPEPGGGFVKRFFYSTPTPNRRIQYPYGHNGHTRTRTRRDRACPVRTPHHNSPDTTPPPHHNSSDTIPIRP